MKYIYAGTLPGQGDYQCIKCNFVTRIYSDSQTLPVCPCGCSEFQKLESFGSNKYRLSQNT